MWLSLIPAERPFPAVVDSLGFDDPLLVVALAVFAVLTLVVLLVAGRKALGTDGASAGDSSSSDPDSDSDVPDESEWTVSYNPPSRRSSDRRSSRSSGSRSSNSNRSRSSGGAAGGSSTSGSASASSSGSDDAAAESATDGSGETRLYDPSDDDPTGTDTRIFTGEKDADQTCPDCEEPLPSGTDWEFCPFCGYEL